MNHRIYNEYIKSYDLRNMNESLDKIATIQINLGLIGNKLALIKLILDFKS
jgi:hypothetical protein